MGASDRDPYQMAIRLLSYRWRSETELRDRLTQKGIDPTEIELTIGRLSEEGWIDDERFAREYVRSRARRHGRRRIGMDLRRLGVDDEAVSRALSEELDQDREDEILLSAAKKKTETLCRRYGNEYTASEAGRKKLARFLLSRGYPEAAVRKTVYELTSRLGNEAGEEREE